MSLYFGACWQFSFVDLKTSLLRKSEMWENGSTSINLSVFWHVKLNWNGGTCWMLELILALVDDFFCLYHEKWIIKMWNYQIYGSSHSMQVCLMKIMNDDSCFILFHVAPRLNDLGCNTEIIILLLHHKCVNQICWYNRECLKIDWQDCAAIQS